MPPDNGCVHHSAPHSPGARGRELGSVHADAVAHTVGVYRRLFAASRGSRQPTSAPRASGYGARSPPTIPSSRRRSRESPRERGWTRSSCSR